MNDYSVRIRTFDRTDPRLGRQVRHDSRSLLFQYAADPAAIASIRHKSVIPTLDQGQVGSCTGHAATKAVSYGALWTPPVDNALHQSDADQCHQYAVSVYSAATAIDPYTGVYPPTDTGSDGLSVAKVLQGRGLISGYQHATSFDAVLTALSRQAVIVGTTWRNDMFAPDDTGRIHVSGDVAGGHEYVLDQLDVENRRIWMQNSWGSGWGKYGRGWFTYEDFQTLMSDYGDCTIFVPASAPAPVPTDPQAAWIKQAEYWISLSHTSKPNALFEKQTQTYINWLKGQA